MLETTLLGLLAVGPNPPPVHPVHLFTALLLPCIIVNAYTEE